jgi:hypothetical protein
MDRYEVGIMPQEAKRLATSPHYRFRAAAEGHKGHIWHVTCIRLLLMKCDGGKTYRALIQIDPIDDAIEDGLKALMTRDKEMLLGKAEEYAGIVRLVANTFSIITYNWTAFLNEADTHLQLLVSLLFMCYTPL